MKPQKFIIGIAAFLGLFILILDSKTALSGASEGIQLCTQAIIPALFPFFILSGVITGCFSCQNVPLLTPLGRLFRIPEGAESILISAFLAGYPVGAQAVTTACRNGQLTKEQSESMLAFCNNPGPSFLFGIVGFLFPDPKTVWVIWGIIILSALMVAQIFPAQYDRRKIRASLPSNRIKPMETALRSMATVCGWIILFRVIIAFMEKWFLWLLSPTGQALLCGVLELANGCSELRTIDSPAFRFLICGCILSWGGLCVTLQTLSVIGDLNPRKYFCGKLLQTFFSFLLCISILHRLWIIPMIMIGYICLGPKVKNSSSISEKGIV